MTKHKKEQLLHFVEARYVSHENFILVLNQGGNPSDVCLPLPDYDDGEGDDGDGEDDGEGVMAMVNILTYILTFPPVDGSKSSKFRKIDIKTKYKIKKQSTKLPITEL